MKSFPEIKRWPLNVGIPCGVRFYAVIAVTWIIQLDVAGIYRSLIDSRSSQRVLWDTRGYRCWEVSMGNWSVGFDNLRWRGTTYGGFYLIQLEQTISSAPISSRYGRKNIWRKVVRINNLRNVVLNFFQNILSGLAEDTVKNPKWQHWGWMK
jgi:hypothetical protein